MKKLALFLVCLFSGAVCFKSFAQMQGQQLVDSLVAALPGAKPDTNKVLLLKNIAFQYSTIDPQKGMKYARQGRELTDRLGWLQGKAWIYNSMGLNYLTTSEYDKALRYFDSSLSINLQTGLKRAQAMNYRNIGIVHMELYNYPKQMEAANKSLKIYKELGDQEGIASEYCSIGNVYLELKLYNKALDLFEQALEICERLNIKRDEGINLNNIGLTYLYMNEYAKAGDYLSRAKKIEEEIGDNYDIALVAGNQGLLARKRQDYDSAIKYYTEMLRIGEQIASKLAIRRAHGGLGLTYLAMAQAAPQRSTPTAIRSTAQSTLLTDAISHLRQCMELTREINAYARLNDYCHGLSEAYLLSGDFRSAIGCLKDYAAASDSFFVARDVLAVDEIARQY